MMANTQLERIVEPQFHVNSYGYRPGKNCHQAMERASQKVMTHHWVIDLDIKGFFDNIDQELLKKAVMHYCKDEWTPLCDSTV